MSERYPQSLIIPSVLLNRRHPLLPLLRRLSPNIYGETSSSHQKDMPHAIDHMDELITAYCQTGVPFVVVNMGLPKAGKTTLAGEEAVYAANRLFTHLLRSANAHLLPRILTYIGYESVQKEVEQRGMVPPGHGPGNQTREDHRVSSRVLEQTTRHSLERGQNVILESPFMAGRGELGTIQDLATHAGIFLGLTYNVRFIWPIPDKVHGIFTMMMRTEYDRSRTFATLQNFGVHVRTGSMDNVGIPGASEPVLRRNFYPDLVRHFAQLYRGFSERGHSLVSKYDVLFSGNDAQLPISLMHRFLADIAPLLMEVLEVAPQESIVGTNSVLHGDKRAQYYGGLLTYLDKFGGIATLDKRV